LRLAIFAVPIFALGGACNDHFGMPAFRTGIPDAGVEAGDFTRGPSRL
jgi:hypothetical protein